MTNENGNGQTRAIARIEDTIAPLVEATGYKAGAIQVAMETVGKGLSPQEFMLFLTVASRTGLDPFARQIYAIKRNQKQQDGSWKGVMVLQTGIDGFRSIGSRTGRYAGMDGPYWCGKDGQWVDVWLEDGYPFAAKVGIYLAGSDRPIWGIAKWREFAQTDGQGKPTTMWAKMPDHMLAKCAEAQAWRKAFPYEMAGVRAEEEVTRSEAAADLPEARLEAQREEAMLITPRAASKRFHTRREGEVIDTSTGEVFDGDVPEDEQAESGRLI